MASSIECKASKVTVSGQGCGTAYIPSSRCRRRRVGREEEASNEWPEKKKKKERAGYQPLADRRERYTTRKRKKGIERPKRTLDRWLQVEREKERYSSWSVCFLYLLWIETVIRVPRKQQLHLAHELSSTIIPNFVPVLSRNSSGG